MVYLFPSVFDNCNSGTSFLCGSTKCIPLMFVCDGISDCWDSQDEMSCNKLNSCEDWWAAGYSISGIYQTGSDQLYAIVEPKYTCFPPT